MFMCKTRYQRTFESASLHRISDILSKMDDDLQHVQAIPLLRSSDFDADPASFSASTWLNHVLSSEGSPSLLDLLGSLDDSLRESHETLDSALKDALKAVPWVVRESERVRQRANSMRSNVETVGKRVTSVESGVVSSVKTIADADTVVRRVQETVSLLETAANADVLLERLESLLASAGADGSDLVAAADVVSQLRKALQPLDGVPEVKDRFDQLERADTRLEKLAAPQLLKALESRNRQAAINSRIVFDHAGRENAFRIQYVNLRSSEVRQLWGTAWAFARSSEPNVDIEGTPNNHRPSNSTSESSRSSPQSVPRAGNLASDHAGAALREFYAQLATLLSTEVEWLRDDFPDVNTALLPALVCNSLASLSDPEMHTNTTPPKGSSSLIKAANQVADNLYNTGLCAVTATAKMGKIFLPQVLNWRDGNDAGGTVDIAEGADPEVLKTAGPTVNIYSTIVDAMTSLLKPHRAFWETLIQSSVQQARTRSEAIEPTFARDNEKANSGASSTNWKPRLSLREIAREVEIFGKEACGILDNCLMTVNTRSCGVGIEAMKQSCEAVSSVVSERLLGIVKARPSSKGEDEWTNLNGALRLLIATSALKRNWDGRRESAFAVAVGTATPILEFASALQNSPEKRVQQFLDLVSNGRLAEAGAVWELVRDERLPRRIVSMFESLDLTTDFESLVDAVHRVVYDTLFSGVVDRFRTFNSGESWNNESADMDGAIAGFSSSPLQYATEVADYLMTVPQQLEPFIPDEEDAKHAMPNSVHAFSQSRSNDEQKKGSVGGNSEKEDSKSDMDMSFAGMWIGVLAIGTMELYVEKICNLNKLSDSGTRQLATDAEYICNVMGSLGVAPTTEMALVSRLLECRKDTVSFNEVAAEYNSVEQRKLIRRVAAVRGVKVTI